MAGSPESKLQTRDPYQNPTSAGSAGAALTIDEEATAKNSGSSESEHALTLGEISKLTAAEADNLLEKGSKAIEDGDFNEAVGCLSQVFELRVSQHHMLTEGLASVCYKYGYALFYRAQEERDPLATVPAKPTGENGNGGESDLKRALKLLNTAKAIVENDKEDTLERVEIFTGLGEVFFKIEDLKASLTCFKQALSISQRLSENDHRQNVVSNYRITLVLELCSMEDALPYFLTAISLCTSRIEELKNDNNLHAEIEFFRGILIELTQKHSDLWYSYLLRCRREPRQDDNSRNVNEQRVHDFSDLPRDICFLIANKLRFFPHLLKFCAASKEWHDISSELLITLAAKIKCEPPMLFYPYDDETQTATFLELENSKMYHLNARAEKPVYMWGVTWMVDDN